MSRKKLMRVIVKENRIGLIHSLLRTIGENPEREGLKDTPLRVSEMYEQLFYGYRPELAPKITVFPNGQDGVDYDQIITDSGYFYSQCEHHMIPFFGQYYFGYIPGKKIIGLSKVARVVDYFSARLQIQERLGREIVGYIAKELHPKGIILQLKARHLCKEMRGAQKVGGQMVTSIAEGVFRRDSSAKSEFLTIINGGLHV